jgi:PAS domain S-box-containing protein
MHYANERWLHVYRYTSSALQVVIIALYALSLSLQVSGPAGMFDAITPIAIVLASVHILFALFIYPGAEKKSAIGATTILGGLLALNTLSLMHVSGGLASPWAGLWAVVCLLVGALGPAIASGPSFLIMFYYILFQTSAFDVNAVDRTLIDVQGLLVVGGTIVISVISWLLWRSTYVHATTAEVQKLTGQLKSRQQLSDILIQSITDAIIVIDTNGVITTMNPAAAEMTGWPAQEAVGIDIRVVAPLHEEDGADIPEPNNIFSSVLAKRESIEKVLQLTNRRSDKLIVSLVVSPIIIQQNSELAGAVAVIRDISEAREEEARRADFISTASHEMRTPVAAIEGYLALALNEKVSRIDSNARSYLIKAHTSTQHLGKLFQDLLTSAKAEDGRLVSNPTVIEMGDYIEKLTDDLRFGAEKKGLLVDLVIGSNKHVENDTSAGVKSLNPLYYATVDPDRLREVITNLFDNAVKYTESGKITIGLTGNDKVVQLFIRDTGPGIPADDIPHLFQKFYRVDNTSTRTIGGTGLGLFICRKIVELYKGRIWVESQEGKGSTFYINLPRVDSSRAGEAQKHLQTAAGTASTNTPATTAKA